MVFKMSIKPIITEKKLIDYLSDSYMTFYDAYIIPEEFIEKYEDKLDKSDWSFIPKYQTLSEKFIEKYKDKVDWFYVSGYQTLSESFIEKHKSYVYLYCILKYQKLSKEFRKIYSIKCSLRRLKRISTDNNDLKSVHI